MCFICQNILKGFLRRGVFEGGRRVGFVVFRNFPLWMMLYGRFVAINLVAYSVVGLIVKSGEERFFVLCKRFILVHGNLFIFLALG